MSNRAVVIVVTTLVTIAWLSFGGRTADGRLHYEAEPYEPGGFRPVMTEPPVPDGPHGGTEVKVAPASAVLVPDAAWATGRRLARHVTAAVAADLAPTVAPTVRPTTHPPQSDATAVIGAPVSPRGYALSKIGAAQFRCLDRLWMKESGWQTRNLNRSSGAYGIPQAVPGSKMASAGADWRTNPITQVRWGLGYIRARYGSACAAWSFWLGHNWY